MEKILKILEYISGVCAIYNLRGIKISKDALIAIKKDIEDFLVDSMLKEHNWTGAI